MKNLMTFKNDSYVKFFLFPFLHRNFLLLLEKKYSSIEKNVSPYQKNLKNEKKN